MTTRSERYADVAPCGRCGKDVVLDHDPPCEHGWVACPECGHGTVCADCRREAEREMFASGEYDPKADPFYNHLAPKGRPIPTEAERKAAKDELAATWRAAWDRYQAWVDETREQRLSESFGVDKVVLGGTQDEEDA